MNSDERGKREQDFWGHHIPSLQQCLVQFRAGPDPNTEAMLQAVEPIRGVRVLDFACGAGVVSAWLAARGAEVVGLDLSPESIDRSQEVLEALGLSATLVCSRLEDADKLGMFDAIVGRYALHHTDVPQMAPLLAQHLRLGKMAAFVETFASNPVLRLSRRHLVGRAGIPRFGTLDERPLEVSDIDALRSAFGSAEIVVSQMKFLRIFDRQVLRKRFPPLSLVLGRIDDALNRLPRSESLSFHQVVALEKTVP